MPGKQLGVNTTTTTTTTTTIKILLLLLLLHYCYYYYYYYYTTTTATTTTTITLLLLLIITIAPALATFAYARRVVCVEATAQSGLRCPDSGPAAAICGAREPGDHHQQKLPRGGQPRRGTRAPAGRGPGSQSGEDTPNIYYNTCTTHTQINI